MQKRLNRKQSAGVPSKRKNLASYPLLMVLILQLGITSLLCAVSSYQAEASTLTICTSFGIKTITIDADGNPIEQNGEHSRFDATCFHCASGGCSVTALLTDQTELYYGRKIASAITTYKANFSNTEKSKPPSRGPPSLA